MSTIDLIILGILLKHPMSAYELTHFVEKNSINKFLKISNPAIYKACKRLYKAGRLDGETVREGELPEKIVYSINKNGKEYFYKLMEYFSKELKPFYFEFNTFLWNIDKIEVDEAVNMLENLHKCMCIFKERIIEHEKEVQHYAPFSGKMIIMQYRMIITTFVQWIEKVIENYKLEFVIE